MEHISQTRTVKDSSHAQASHLGPAMLRCSPAAAGHATRPRAGHACACWYDSWPLVGGAGTATQPSAACCCKLCCFSEQLLPIDGWLPASAETTSSLCVTCDWIIYECACRVLVGAQGPAEMAALHAWVGRAISAAGHLMLLLCTSTLLKFAHDERLRTILMACYRVLWSAGNESVCDALPLSLNCRRMQLPDPTTQHTPL